MFAVLIVIITFGYSLQGNFRNRNDSRVTTDHQNARDGGHQRHGHPHCE